jgi:hypothetical protein
MADDLNLLYGTVSDGGGTKTWADPGNANDGVSSSYAVIGSYAAGTGTYEGYLESDLGSVFDVGELVVWGDYGCSSDPRADPDNGWEIEYSDDGITWSVPDYTASRFDAGALTERVRYVLGAVYSYQYWRLRHRDTIAGLGFRCGSNVQTFEIFGAVSPTEPPTDPGYTPPEPGHAILEIYVHDEDATRWGTATWGDNPPTGSTGIWSGAGWQDVTPQGLRAHVAWGTSRPERGILSTQEAQSWLVETYDPDRVLDPGNESSPYAPQLVSGVPIRISSSVSGRTIRTGIIDKIAYSYKAPEYRGTIAASSTIAYAWRADVPEDATLGDTLRERVRDAVAASGIAIGGVPILGFTDSFPDIPLSAKIDGAEKLWTHIYKAGEEALWIIYEDAAGTLQSAPYGGGVDRGSEITYANLEDLKAESADDGIYSVVRVTIEDGSDVIERVAAPLPRYGRVPYERTEKTINPEAWADAVLADRAWPGVVWTPGTVWCFTEADVDFMASLELTERVRIVVPGVVDIAGQLLGMEMWVEAKDATETRWLFLPRISTAGAVALGDTILAADDGSGDFLLADDGSGDFLEYEG